ncbi:sensor histidine kinase KdpD, partial [Pedobacter sp. HMWF019]|uniref:sensor histidine kinase n=1 Tax=Pedobacter sp. HMWF019 TaxID=2056856 RepID=UPI001E28DB3C
VSMASHEFRTPLSSVQLSASLIEKYAQPFQNKHIEKHVSKIKNAVGNLTTILNDFLSLERLEAGGVEPTFSSFDLVKLAEEITEEMQMIAKQDQNIIYQHTGLESMVMLDQNLLKNCMINLIGNAIKYSGENTFIEFNTEINESQCIVTIKDNGIGIPESDQIHLFQPFFRANNTGNIPGTGLGLNIVLRYVTLMRGEVQFNSIINKETTFILSFNK